MRIKKSRYKQKIVYKKTLNGINFRNTCATICAIKYNLHFSKSSNATFNIRIRKAAVGNIKQVKLMAL